MAGGHLGDLFCQINTTCWLKAYSNGVIKTLSNRLELVYEIGYDGWIKHDGK